MTLIDYNRRARDRRPPATEVRDTTRRSQVMTETATYAPPVGALLEYAGTVLPSDGKWLWADGATYSASQFPELYEVIGGTFNSGGEPADQFSVPDRRGRVAIGAGEAAGLTNRVLGSKVGSESVALTVSEMPPHTHTIEYRRQMNANINGSASRDIIEPSNDSEHETLSTGGSGFTAAAHTNMQPSLAFNFMIRALP